MPALTTETTLTILINWLRDNTDSATLLPHVEQALNDVRDLRYLQLLQRSRSE